MLLVRIFRISLATQQLTSLVVFYTTYPDTSDIIQRITTINSNSDDKFTSDEIRKIYHI